MFRLLRIWTLVGISAGCGQRQLGAPPSAAASALSTASLYQVVFGDGGGEHRAALAQVGVMNFRAYYQTVLARVSDAPITINNMTISGVATKLRAQAGVYEALGTEFDDINAYWRATSFSPETVVSEADFQAQLSSLFSKPAEALALDFTPEQIPGCEGCTETAPSGPSHFYPNPASGYSLGSPVDNEEMNRYLGDLDGWIMANHPVTSSVNVFGDRYQTTTASSGKIQAQRLLGPAAVSYTIVPDTSRPGACTTIRCKQSGLTQVETKAD